MKSSRVNWISWPRLRCSPFYFPRFWTLTQFCRRRNPSDIKIRKRSRDTQTIPPPKFYRAMHCNVNLKEVGRLKNGLKTLWIHPCLGFLLRLVRLRLLAFERIACSRCDRHLAGSGMILASLRPNFAQLLPYLVPVPILLLPPLWFNFALGLLRRFLLSLSMIAIFGSFHDTFTTARLL